MNDLERSIHKIRIHTTHSKFNSQIFLFEVNIRKVI